MFPGDRMIFCKMCKEDRVHMDLEMPGSCRWKCKRCGEYNQPKVEEEDCPLCGGSGKIVNRFGEDDIEFEACPCGEKVSAPVAQLNRATDF